MTSFLVAENGSGETTSPRGAFWNTLELDFYGHHGKHRKHRNKHTGGPWGWEDQDGPLFQRPCSPWHTRLSFVNSKSHRIGTLSRLSFAPGALCGPSNQKAHVTECPWAGLLPVAKQASGEEGMEGSSSAHCPGSGGRNAQPRP